MIPLAVVVPEERIAATLRPLVEEALRRRIPITDGRAPVRVAVGLDGFVPTSASVRIAVDNFFDCWRHPPDPTQTMCYASLYHLETHAHLWGTLPIYGAIVGSMLGEVSHHPWVTRDTAVFFTPKMRGVDPERRRGWFRSYYWRSLVTAKRAALASGLRFIIKTRRKHGDPWWIRGALGDHGDSVALLSRARWCVHFGSGAALEAALGGAFAYWYPSPEAHLISSPGSSLRARMFAWPGVSRIGVPGGELMDGDARSRYLDTYLGECDGKAAARVLDLAERS